MNCAEIELLLQARVDGECAPAEDEQIEAHLAGCAACRAADAELQVLVGQLETMYAARESEAPKLSVPGVPTGARKLSGQVVAAVEPAAAPEAAAPPAEPEAEAAAPSLVSSGYRIEAPIARGGFGAVYRAVQLSLDRPVALKLLAPHLAHDREFVARFLREAKVAATLSHPNLVAIYDVGQQGQQLYYAMELVEGEDVEVVLKRDGFVPPRRAAEIALGVARALAAADAAGIVHRDVKPANVLLTRQGAPKLADLGLAKALEEEQGATGSLTVAKKVIGSPNYMSPEQAQDIRKATPKADVYSLGATLLHMLSGRVPFGTGSPVEVLARVLRDPPAIPEQLPSGEKLDPALRGLLARLLAKDPAQRPDAAELVGSLEAWLAGRHVGDRSLEETDEVVVTSSGHRMTSGRRGQSKKSRRASDRAVPALHSSGRLTVRRGGGKGHLALAAAAVVLLCAGLLIAFKERPEPPSQVAQEPKETRTAPETPRKEVSPAPRRTDPVAPPRPAEGGSAREAEAERAIQDYEQWMMAHREETGERWRRAQEVELAFPGTSGGARAEKHRIAVETEMTKGLAEAQERADQLEAQERLGEAREALLAFLDRSGEEAPQGVQARVALSAIEARLDVKLEGDLGRLEGLLASGAVDDARALVAAVRRYADSGRAARAQEKLDAFLSGQKPAPDGPVAADKGKTPPADPKADPRLAEALALVAQGKEALDKRDYPAVREALRKLRQEYGKVPGVTEEADGLMAALDKALTPPEDGALLAAWLHGKVKPLGGQRLEVSYDFESEAEAADWVAVENWGEGLAAQAHAALEAQVRPPSGIKEPWTVRRGTLAAYGWSRRRFAAPLRTDEPIVIEVKAKGGQNVVVALQDPGRARSALFAANFQLEELPLGEIGTAAIRRGGGGEPAKRLQELKRLIEVTRKRGPALAVLREDGFLNLDELDAQPGKMSSPAFTVALRPDGKDRHQAAVTVGKRTFPEVELEQGDAVWITLATLGAPVAWDEITITGTVREDMLQRLRDAAKQVGSEPEALRKELKEGDERRAKEDEERKKREAERRRQEEERRRRGADRDGDKDKKGEGEKKEPEKDDDKRDGRGGR